MILPLLGADNSLVRWQIVQSITRTKSFLEKGGPIVDVIINILLKDKSPMVRVEAASMLGYCKSTPQVITSLEYARDNDFESDDGYVVGHIAAESLKRIKERFVEIRKTQK